MDRMKSHMTRRKEMRYERAHGTWEDLFRTIDAGTVQEEYASGDSFALDLGPVFGTVHMVLSDFSVDELADGTGKAAVTLIARETLRGSHRWNPALQRTAENGYVSGTGSVGGWAESEVRAYLRSQVWESVPEMIRNRIAVVNKNSRTFQTDGACQSDFITADTIFLPSLRETGRTVNCETLGIRPYTALNSEETRKAVAAGTETLVSWFLRSGSSCENVHRISPTGRTDSYITANPSINHYLRIAFCVC